MRSAQLILFGCAFLAIAASTGAQTTASRTPGSKSAPDSGTKRKRKPSRNCRKRSTPPENDRAALVRNLKDYLRRFPDAPRKAAIDRALVEACQQLRDDDCALDYSETIDRAPARRFRE